MSILSSLVYSSVPRQSVWRLVEAGGNLWPAPFLSPFHLPLHGVRITWGLLLRAVRSFLGCLNPRHADQSSHVSKKSPSTFLPHPRHRASGLLLRAAPPPPPCYFPFYGAIWDFLLRAARVSLGCLNPRHVGLSLLPRGWWLAAGSEPESAPCLCRCGHFFSVAVFSF